ncbi:nitrite reductase small subunit NirD [Croceicoccus sp. YJ47]|uniref:nitrite reductase small subunit NirD n=1 Tax=Croceicoccus sp. YJ47 TaxID=2798724 RepID=UPI00192089FD|nr:nitrite reductase small subunit NirD [Croceicoccus sp. YJ47]QQN74283.1 nitrite reductase small subunit NirD [Croceicoccus sp. YJ47]
MSWTDVGALSDIPLRGARMVKTAKGCVAIFRTGEEELFATSNSCAHRQGPLAEGIVHGRMVTCPLHSWTYSLETGEAQGADEGIIATYPVRIEAGRVLLDVSALAQKAAA